MRIDVTVHADATAFLAAVGPRLYDEEVRNHLVLGIAEARAREAADGVWYLTVEQSGQTTVAAIMSVRHPTILAPTVSRADESLGALAAWIVAGQHAPRAFIADVGHAEPFARAWEALGGRAALRMRQRLHSLREVAEHAPVPGRMRQAHAGDLELLTQWMEIFNAEALGQAPDPELRDGMTRRLERGELFLWDEGEPRAMAAVARPTRHGIAINGVYTPSAWRGRGYATAIVATLSQRMLDAGRTFCVLFTDLTNPTSNAIYARIGYRPVSDSLVFDLVRS